VITDIYLEPIGRTFARTEIEAYLAKVPHTARDATNHDIYMIADDDNELREAHEARKRDPKRFPTSVILIDVGEERIEISYRTSRVAPARRFVDWLRGHYELKVMDEELNDITAEARDLDVLFSAES